MPLPSKNPQRRHYVLRSCSQPAVRCPSDNRYFACYDFFYTLCRFEWKLPQNIRRGSGHCWKACQGQRSKVKIMTRPNAVMAEACISTVLRRGSLVQSFIVTYVYYFWLLSVRTSLRYNSELQLGSISRHTRVVVVQIHTWPAVSETGRESSQRVTHPGLTAGGQRQQPRRRRYYEFSSRSSSPSLSCLHHKRSLIKPRRRIRVLKCGGPVATAARGWSLRRGPPLQWAGIWREAALL